MTKYTTPHSLPIIEPAVDKIAAPGTTNLAANINALSTATNTALDAQATATAEVAGEVVEQGQELANQGDRVGDVETVLSSPTMPKEGEPDGFEIVDSAGKASFQGFPDGSLGLGNTVLIPSKELTFEDQLGKVAFGLSRFGEVLGPLSRLMPITKAVIIPCLGQSNAVSMSALTTPEVDVPDPRIWQMPYGGTNLTPAGVPLSGQGTITGIAPGHILAKEYLKDEPQTLVILVPAAIGGAGLGLATTSTSGVWAVDYAGPYRKLFETAVQMTLAAAAACQAKWGITPTYLAATWNQGEQDGADATPRATYEAELDKLISTFRTRIGSQVPFVIGGMVPEWVEESGTASRADIRKALLDTPRRVERTAYADGIRNAGGALGLNTDLVHYTREGIKRLGRAMYRELPRAQNNIAASKISTPLDLVATVWGGELEATWTAPTCRVTSYEIQTSPPGTPVWTSLTRGEAMETRQESPVTGPVKVRVRATGPTGTSMYSTPAKAIGA